MAQEACYVQNDAHLVHLVDIFTEASWGADYLESIGGFRNLEYDGDARFPSSIAPNGTVQWNSITATSLTESASGAIVTHRVTFPNIDWAFMRTVYGWASVQYQAWIRGEIIVQRSETQPFVLYSDQILEFWVDDVHYFGGDLYVFRKAPPVLHLGPGRHRLDVRLVRDVRAMGGVDEPSIDIKFEIKPSTGRLELAKEGIVISDLVDGILASDVAAVAVRNSGTKPVKIFGIEDREVSLSEMFHRKSASSYGLSATTLSLTISRTRFPPHSAVPICLSCQGRLDR